MDGCMDGWVDGWMKAWMDGWMGGWIGEKVKGGQLSRCWGICSTIVKVAQSCPTLCNPMDYTVLKFFRPENWSK